MPRKTKKDDNPVATGAPAWMATFSDLTTLLMTFFILLYSFSMLDVQKFRIFIASFKGMGALETGLTPVYKPERSQQQRDNPIFNSKRTEHNMVELIQVRDTVDSKVPQDATKRNVGNLKEVQDKNPYQVKEIDRDLVKVFNQILLYLDEKQLNNDITAEFGQKGVELTIREKLLFDSGKAVLRKEALAILDQLAGLFKKLPNDIAVEGHTDNVPTNPRMYPTNWELSAARSIAVVRYLTENKGLDAEKFVAVGYGEFQPVAPNDTEENKQRNRRVVIKVMTQKAQNQQGDG